MAGERLHGSATMAAAVASLIWFSTVSTSSGQETPAPTDKSPVAKDTGAPHKDRCWGMTLKETKDSVIVPGSLAQHSGRRSRCVAGR